MTTDAKKAIKGKITKHKISVLQLFELHKHLEVNEIYNKLNQQNEKISLATIYRILSAFELDGLIIRNNLNENLTVYEFANPTEHHDHLICTKCNKLFEFFNEELEDLQEKIAANFGFQILKHCLNIYGLCKDCAHK